MKTYVLISLILVVAAAVGWGWWLTQSVTPTADMVPVTTDTITTVTAPDVGISFAYPEGSAGYQLLTLEADAATDLAFIRLYTLVTPETAALMTSEGEATEFPPSISLAVYHNTAGESAAAWAEAHPEWSNISLVAGTVDRAVTLDAVPAVRYMVDGLYYIDTIVAVQGPYAYVLSGARLTPEDTIVADFDALVSSIRFITVDTAAE